MIARLLCCVALLTPAQAQGFDPLENGFLPRYSPGLWWHVGSAAGDMDGDGDIDLVRIARFQNFELLTNDGEGRFTSRVIAINSGAADLVTVTAADLDGDGDADLLFGLAQDPNGAIPRLLRNDGNGAFTDVTASMWSGNAPATTRQILAFDMDGDGDLDVVCNNTYTNFKCGPSCGSPPSQLFRNDGTGHLTLAASFASPAAPAIHTDVSVFDYDGDGLEDILFGGLVPHLHRNLGNGMFSTTPIVIGAVMMHVLATDLDADGDADLLSASGYHSPVELRRNDGQGVFTLVATPQLPASPIVMKVGDLDGDARPDLVIAIEGDTDGNQLLRNMGNLTFQNVTSTWLEAQNGKAGRPLLFDADQDGDLDLYDGCPGIDRLLINDGQGRMARLEAWDPGLLLAHAMMQAVDLDNDGHGDLVGFTRGESSDTVRWWRGDEFGGFTAMASLGFGAQSSCSWRSITPFDADQDGDRDLLLGLCDQLVLLANDGTGTFTDVTATALPVVGGPIASVEPGDFDVDGDVDLLIARPGGIQDSFYRNDGTGRFVDVGTSQLTDPHRTFDLAVADFDGDGDLDVVTTNYTTVNNLGPVLLLDNDGSGMFADVTALRMPSIRADHVTVADIDGDGDADLVLGGFSGVAFLLRNDHGTFVDTSGQLPPLQDTWWPQAGDMNGDRALDLRIGDQWLQNDGLGTFTATGITSVSSDRYKRQKQGVADLDDDGDADMLVAGLQHNLLRQLETALPPRVGFHAELRLHARSIAAGFDPIATILLATGLATPPIPLGSFGSWRLDPNRTFVHTTHVIPENPGHVTVRFLVPNHVSMLGTHLWAQAFFCNGPLPAYWRSGNTLPLQVRR